MPSKDTSPCIIIPLKNILIKYKPTTITTQIYTKIKQNYSKSQTKQVLHHLCEHFEHPKNFDLHHYIIRIIFIFQNWTVPLWYSCVIRITMQQFCITISARKKHHDEKCNEITNLFLAFGILVAILFASELIKGTFSDN